MSSNSPCGCARRLINILYLFPVNSLWAATRPPIGPWCDPKDGLFGMIDGLVEDPGMEPLPDTFYANAPIVYFFPDLAHSTLRGYKAYQFTNGQAPWVFGGIIGGAKGGYEPTAGTEMASPSPGYQSTTTGPSYVDLVDRYWQRTGDDGIPEGVLPFGKEQHDLHHVATPRGWRWERDQRAGRKPGPQSLDAASRHPAGMV